MTANPLRDLEQCEQSIWLDSISRDLLRSGTFARLIEEDGITGVTANPSIFEKAIVGTHDYDEDIRALGAKGRPAIQIYEDLAIQDVGAAADMLRATYDGCGGSDGFASIEVSPNLAYDTRTSIEEASGTLIAVPPLPRSYHPPDRPPSVRAASRRPSFLPAHRCPDTPR